MVGKIIKGNPIKDFQGYVSKRDTTKKTIPDCFTKGDVGFSSGNMFNVISRIGIVIDN